MTLYVLLAAFGHEKSFYFFNMAVDFSLILNICFFQLILKNCWVYRPFPMLFPLFSLADLQSDILRWPQNPCLENCFSGIFCFCCVFHSTQVDFSFLFFLMAFFKPLSEFFSTICPTVLLGHPGICILLIPVILLFDSYENIWKEVVTWKCCQRGLLRIVLLVRHISKTSV